MVAESYLPRAPAGSLLQQFLREHLPAFLRQSGGELPRYVVQELEAAAQPLGVGSLPGAAQIATATCRARKAGSSCAALQRQVSSWSTGTAR